MASPLMETADPPTEPGDPGPDDGGDDDDDDAEVVGMGEDDNTENGQADGIEGEAARAAAVLDQMRLPVTDEDLTADAGCGTPETASAKMRSLNLPLAGQYAIGDRIRVWVECVVTDVDFHADLDKHSLEITGVNREHALRPVRIRPVED